MSDRREPLSRADILAQRAAFEAGVAAVWNHFGLADEAYGRGWRGSSVLAAERFPLPMVERYRVIRAGGYDWRVAQGVIQWQKPVGDCCPHDIRWDGGDAFPRFHALAAEKPEILRAWADLLENPVEMVEENA